MSINNGMPGFGPTNKTDPATPPIPFYYSVTYAQLQVLIAGSGLVPGATYQINDRSNNLGYYLTALTNNSVSLNGERLQYVPKTYLEGLFFGFVWLGVWRNSLLGVAAGDLCIWGGRVWVNVTGAVGANTSEFLLDANWNLVPVTDATKYTIKSFFILFDNSNDWILKQWDENGNVIGVPYSKRANYSNINPVDVSDWNQSTSNKFYNNQFERFLNNRSTGEIYNNTITGDCYFNTVGNFYNNVCGNTSNNIATSISANTLTGAMRNNSLQGWAINNNFGNIISDNNCLGDISENSIDQITNNTNAGYIRQNFGLTITNNAAPCASIQNNNCGLIANNTNDGNIEYNNMKDAINSNSNNGNIFGNYCKGPIILNTNNGEISYNGCAKDISQNNNNGHILSNQNNGRIVAIAAATTDIEFNINNGNIAITVPGVISDPVVNK